MTRKLLGALCLLVSVSLSASAQFFDPPALQDRNGNLGLPFYMLEVPDADDMVIDGRDDDWEWFDPDYTLTMDEWRDEADRTLPSREDLNITTRLGWKGGDVNRWYIYLEAFDDVLKHDGTSVRRWDGDMLQIGHDPQDHGRQRGPASGYTMEWIMAPGDVTEPNSVRFRYFTENANWLGYGEPPWIDVAIAVDPPEAWAADLWVSGGSTVYEVGIKVLAFQDDAGPGASEVWQMDAVSGRDGDGFPFNIWYEDGDGPDEEGDTFGELWNDMTIRGAEASGRQYYALATLLRLEEYAPQLTAVEHSTWANIKHALRQRP